MIPKISFIVAVYKVADYIEECMRSLCRQTLRDIEIVAVDDCSPDDCMDKLKSVVDEFPERKDQVKLIRHTRNMGLPFARRDGFAAATGEYVIFVDGDDYVDERMAELMYEKAIQTGADQVVCDFYKDYGESKLQGTIVKGEIGEKGKRIDDAILDCQSAPYVWLKAIRRDLFFDHIFMWPTQGMGEDTVISSQVSYYSRLTAHLPIPLYFYRQSNNSFCRTKSKDWAMVQYHQFRENVLTYLYFLEREGILNKYRHGVVTKKYYTKIFLFPYLDSKEMRKLWLNTFPEINLKLIFGCSYYHPTVKERMRTLTLCLHIYPIVKWLDTIIGNNRKK
ncbi:MAG: glycosyltransferase [Bacteroidales bacterium]|nr:glycosyltransferase [Bacteroidales bacterium]